MALHPPLLVDLVLALTYALVGGVVARRLGLPTIVGYLLAGLALGPFTPGCQGDVASLRQLAELGVILLMFGIGLHFSLRDLWQVRRIAIPGALLQMAAAGVVVSESPFSHQVGADLLPFREAFAVLFFVSVGMLVNPAYLASHWREVAALTVLIVAGKSAVAALIGFAFPYPARTAVVVGAGLSQIGEFSFIVGQSGLALGLGDLDID